MKLAIIKELAQGQIDINDRLLKIIEAALVAGKIVMNNYGKSEAKIKSDKSLVTNADLESDEKIREVLKCEMFKNYSIIDEESKEFVGNKKEGEDEYHFIIDPIDGTTNYSIKVPFFNISIGLFKNKKPFIGVVYNPHSQELFFAEKNKGAFLLELEKEELTKIKVSEEEDFKKGINAFCHSNKEDAINKMLILYGCMKNTNPKYRQFGAGALELCYVACGRIMSFNMPGINLWDVAAGAIIAKEAGAIVTDFKGEEFNFESVDLLAASRKTHTDILKFIDEAL